MVEDDAAIHDVIDKILIKNGYEVIDAYSGTEAIDKYNKCAVDLVILDLMLPDLSGEEIISKIGGPIIVLSAKISEEDKVNCLLKGASDYMTKPFGKNELLARIEVQLRKVRKDSSRLTYGPFELDEKIWTLYVDGRGVSLTKSEIVIMKVLLSNPERIHSKAEILDRLFEISDEVDENSLKVHIFNIRKKVKNISSSDAIKSVYGIGFKLVDKS